MKKIKKLYLVKNDRGTKELAEKKLLGLTEEPLDLCLSKKIITEEEHRAGIHLRWLYSVKFGIQNITTRPQFMEEFSPMRDEAWMIRKNFEYRQALDALMNSGAAKEVMNICIYGRAPAFLNFSQRSLRYNRKNFEEYNRLKLGLKTLVKLWQRAPSPANAKKSVK